MQRQALKGQLTWRVFQSVEAQAPRCQVISGASIRGRLASMDISSCAGMGMLIDPAESVFPSKLIKKGSGWSLVSVIVTSKVIRAGFQAMSSMATRSYSD